VKKLQLASLLLLTVFIAGCETSAVLSDVSEDAVRVQAMGNDRAMIMPEARRGCTIYGRTPIEISYRCLDEYCIQKEYLFACKPPK